jgi:hypothetical protein
MRATYHANYFLFGWCHAVGYLSRHAHVYAIGPTGMDLLRDFTQVIVTSLAFATSAA